MGKIFKLLWVLLFGLAWLCVPSHSIAALRGQKATCGNGPQKRVVELTANEGVVDIGEGLRMEAWTFNGASPGPTIEVCQGDRVKIVVHNKGAMAHGLDSHAYRINISNFGPVAPGKTMAFERKVSTPGVFMYHCANGAVTDQHIKMGMYGAMIVYPRKSLRRAHEIAVSENGIYGKPDQKGLISPSSDRMVENRAYFVAYNGKLNHKPVKVKAGELVRVYFVNAGPHTSAFHIIGSILDRAYVSGNPRNVLYDIQTLQVPAGSGASFEFRVAEPGTNLLVDHDKLAQLPNGLGIPIVAR
ncbi:MAG: multicopper oxidase domain-containing protein [Candidatus Binatia bacterium]